MKRAAAASATLRPVATLPVKQTTSATATSARPVSAPPVTRANTDASSGTRCSARCRGTMKRGVTSLGFTSTAQPAASAGTASISDSVTGKFQGLMQQASVYGTYWSRIVTVGSSRDGNSVSSTSDGACAAQRRMLRIAPSTSPTEIVQRPVSVNSAATSSSRSAATSSAQRASTAQRDATSRSDHARCAARRRAASAATSAGDATSI